MEKMNTDEWLKLACSGQLGGQEPYTTSIQDIKRQPQHSEIKPGLIR